MTTPRRPQSFLVKFVRSPLAEPPEITDEEVAGCFTEKGFAVEVYPQGHDVSEPVRDAVRAEWVYQNRALQAHHAKMTPLVAELEELRGEIAGRVRTLDLLEEFAARSGFDPRAEPEHG